MASSSCLRPPIRDGVAEPEHPGSSRSYWRLAQHFASPSPAGGCVIPRDAGERRTLGAIPNKRYRPAPWNAPASPPLSTMASPEPGSPAPPLLNHDSETATGPRAEIASGSSGAPRAGNAIVRSSAIGIQARRGGSRKRAAAVRDLADRRACRAFGLDRRPWPAPSGDPGTAGAPCLGSPGFGAGRTGSAFGS